MYIPNEWEPAEWDEAGVKENRRRSTSRRDKRTCSVSVGAKGQRETQVHVPHLPGKLDGYGEQVATALWESGVPACVVVEGAAEEKGESVADSGHESSARRFSSPLPPFTVTYEKEPDGIRGTDGSDQGNGKPDGVRHSFSAETAFAEVHGATEFIR